MTTTMQVAKERRLDWLLDEALGGRRAGNTRAQLPARTTPWLAAAVALLAIGASLGVAWLRADERRNETQDPGDAIPWHECHGADQLDKVPADVTALRCFDFDDGACARLAKFAKLEHLDLSGIDVNDQGYAVSLKITDAGVRALAPLTTLRSLSLAHCEHLKGRELRVLEAMPRLESLDLEHSGIEAPAIWRLARLPNLRSLSLSYCMNFHGSALAAVASLPGLRKLELRGCVTLSAKDAMALANMKQLRHLDLRDCQGRFRGQTLQVDAPGDPADPGQATFVDTDDDGLPDARILPPVQDGIGITDEVVAALSALPLETLLLGGSESLTDAIGESLAKMTTLRSLDLSNLPKLSDTTLPSLPASLESLSLRDSKQLRATMLPPLPGLRSLDATGLSLSATDVQRLFTGRSIEQLSVGAIAMPNDVVIETLDGDAAGVLASAKSLRQLHLYRCSWLDPFAVIRIAGLANLQELDLNHCTTVTDDAVAALAGCRSLKSLKLTWCAKITDANLDRLADAPLRELDLYGTKCDPARVRELAAKHWPGCTITLPNGQRFRTP